MQIDAGGGPIDRSEVARALIQRLDHWYDASRSGGIDILNSPWQSRSEHLGKSVRIKTTTANVTGCLIAIALQQGLTLAVPLEAGQERTDGNTFNLLTLPIGDILTLDADSGDCISCGAMDR